MVKPGQVISERYRLLRLLDVGGMGEVWAARNILTKKNFAIKFLLPALAERPDSLSRFMREAETAGSLEHPSIVDVYDVAQAEDGRPYIVMELLPGESLEARLERAGPLSSLEAAAYLAQIADGLELAHRAGIVHRDLSSANIFLAKSAEGGRPVPKILDFGVSKTLGPGSHDRTQTGHGAVLGCPEFMSPEQARGAESVDARTDVWSLGAVLYQSLAGVVPFRAKNYNALMMAILTRPHRPLLEVAPSIDRELAELVEKCLQKDRNLRVGSSREVSEALGHIARRLSGEQLGDNLRRRATDRLPGTAERERVALATASAEPRRLLRRARVRTAAVGLLCALSGLAAGAVFASAHPLTRLFSSVPLHAPAKPHDRPAASSPTPTARGSRETKPPSDETSPPPAVVEVARSSSTDQKVADHR